MQRAGHPRRGAADRGQRRQAAGTAAPAKDLGGDDCRLQFLHGLPIAVVIGEQVAVTVKRHGNRGVGPDPASGGFRSRTSPGNPLMPLEAELHPTMEQNWNTALICGTVY
jgi:hypothetical protein